MAKYRVVAPCFFGAEKTLSFEVRKAGGEDISVSDGRVYFSANDDVIAACNLRCRTAERFLILLKTFTAETFDELFDGVYDIPFEKLIPKDGRFPVKGASLSSTLSSVPACQSIVKKAVVKRLQKGHNSQFLTERGRQFSLRFSLRKNVAEIFLDTSGEGLHKRGYRRVATLAPIRETLAATIVDLARVRTDSRVIDPCCGSGTLIIEAAQKALGIAPGLSRSFAAERNGLISPDVWKRQRDLAAGERRQDVEFSAVGYDIDEEALSIAKNNAQLAGVDKHCRFELADINDFAPEDGTIILANPPYGERLGDEKQARDFVTALGNATLKTDTSSYIISPESDFERLFGKKADRRRKMYNGMMSCQIFMYFNK